MRPWVLVVLFLFGGCRCRSEYRQDITNACMDEAMKKHRAHAERDGGPFDANSACKDCCHERGFDNVEPGPCACGHLGMDGLTK